MARALAEAYYPLYAASAMIIDIFGEDDWEDWIKVNNVTWVDGILRPVFADAGDAGTHVTAGEVATVTSFPPPQVHLIPV